MQDCSNFWVIARFFKIDIQTVIYDDGHAIHHLNAFDVLTSMTLHFQFHSNLHLKKEL